VEKKDLRKIAKSTGATFVTSMANPDGTESFSTDYIGTCDEIYEETVGD